MSVATRHYRWLKLRNVPLAAWSPTFFATVAGNLGRLVCLDDDTRKHLDFARMLIGSPSPSFEDSFIEVSIGGETTKVWVEVDHGGCEGPSPQTESEAWAPVSSSSREVSSKFFSTMVEESIDLISADSPESLDYKVVTTKDRNIWPTTDEVKPVHSLQVMGQPKYIVGLSTMTSSSNDFKSKLEKWGYVINFGRHQPITLCLGECSFIKLQLLWPLPRWYSSFDQISVVTFLQLFRVDTKTLSPTATPTFV